MKAVQTPSATRSRATPAPFACQPEALAPAAPWSDEPVGDAPTSGGFVRLLDAFRASGGTVPGDVLAGLLQDHHCGDFISLARLIVTGQLFAFEWCGSLWIPMFQLDPHDLSIRLGPQRVRAERSGAACGWPVAAWFARPNAWLGQQKPVDLLDIALPAVLNAARDGQADRRSAQRTTGRAAQAGSRT